MAPACVCCATSPPPGPLPGQAPAAAAAPASDAIHVRDFLRGKAIMVTGATGFVAKCLVEKML